MGRAATGQVITRRSDRTRRKVYALRFSAYGRRRYVTLGTPEEGWTDARAEEELQNVLADVRRGIWQPQRIETPSEPEPEPTFHEFASEWYEGNRPEWNDRTAHNYLAQLRLHLLPFFGEHLVSAITVGEVDRYRQAKQRQGQLSARYINTTITRLGQILEVAFERELIPRNPVKVNPRRRKLRVSNPKPVYLTNAEQIVAMLDAATELDATPLARTSGRRAFIATLIFAGLRITEACNLERRDVDLANGRISVRASKTDAGVRDVEMLPVLRDELSAYLAGGDLDPYAVLFPTDRGARRDKDNARQRVIKPAVKRAEAIMLRRHNRPLPEGVTAHKLRHTFASLLAVMADERAGRGMRHTMAQLGHTDPGFTLRVYSHVMALSERELAQLRALIEGDELALTGTSGRSGTDKATSSPAPETTESPAVQGIQEVGAAGLEPATSSLSSWRSPN